MIDLCEVEIKLILSLAAGVLGGRGCGREWGGGCGSGGVRVDDGANGMPGKKQCKTLLRL